MARYEIVGLHNCPWYARAEKLAEELQFQFSNIEFNKTMKDELQWQDFVIRLKQSRGWEIKASPVIWEILVEPHGKVNLIGGINDFCEYVQAFFGLVIDIPSSALEFHVKLNKELFSRGFHGQDRGDKSICNVSLISGSSGLKLIECLLTQLLSPTSIVSSNILFNIVIFNDSIPQRELDGLTMETFDLSSPNLFRVTAGNSLREAIYNSHLVIILEDLRRKVEESVEDWLNRVEWKSLKYADEINQVASDYCRIIIGGDGPQCYIAEILRQLVSKKKVRSGHLVAVGQHIVTRAKALICKKTEVPGGCIGRVVAYGWPGSVGAYVEIRDAIFKDGDKSIQGPSPCEIPLAEIALNPKWLFGSFATEFLQSQQNQIDNSEKVFPSDMCQAEAVANLLHLWLMSTSEFGPIPQFTKDQICCQTFPNYYTSEGSSPENNDIILPVISVGIKCSKRSSFPRGTFMVQPSVCYRGKWIPAGSISEGTEDKIVQEVMKLFKLRQELIYKDSRLSGVISDYDLDLACDSVLRQPIGFSEIIGEDEYSSGVFDAEEEGDKLFGFGMDQSGGESEF